MAKFPGINQQLGKQDDSSDDEDMSTMMNMASNPNSDERMSIYKNLTQPKVESNTETSPYEYDEGASGGQLLKGLIGSGKRPDSSDEWKPKGGGIEPSVSPLDFITPGGVVRAGRGLIGAGKAIGEAAPRLLGNEIGSAGSNVIPKTTLSEKDPVAMAKWTKMLQEVDPNYSPEKSVSFLNHNAPEYEQAYNAIKQPSNTPLSMDQASRMGRAQEMGFDPSKASSSNILAGLGGATAVGSQLSDEDKFQQLKRSMGGQ